MESHLTCRVTHLSLISKKHRNENTREHKAGSESAWWAHKQPFNIEGVNSPSLELLVSPVDDGVNRSGSCDKTSGELEAAVGCRSLLGLGGVPAAQYSRPQEEHLTAVGPT